MKREYVVRGRRKTAPLTGRPDARVTLETPSVAFKDVPQDETTARAIV